MNENMSPADIAAVVDNNKGYPYPPYMYSGNGFGNGFGGESGWLWIIIILALFRRLGK